MNKQLSYQQFEKGIKSGDTAYNPVIMWFWNGEITKDEVEFQINCFKKVGINEFYIHPMYNLDKFYLSEEFFEMIKYAVHIAKSLGMKYSIYDEYNWPSGVAGGQLLKDEPWTRARTMVRQIVEVQAGEKKDIVLKSHDGLEYLPGKINPELFFVAINKNGEEIDAMQYVRTHRTDAAYTVTLKNVNCGASSFIIYYTHWTMDVLPCVTGAPFCDNEGGYLDVCSKRAVKRFITYSNELYKQAIGDEFGKTVHCLFTDEPSMWVVVW